MLLATLTWPEASVRMVLIAAVALVLSVLIWSVFRTGQTAIRKEAELERRSRRHLEGGTETRPA